MAALVYNSRGEPISISDLLLPNILPLPPTSLSTSCSTSTTMIPHRRNVLFYTSQTDILLMEKMPRKAYC